MERARLELLQSMPVFGGASEAAIELLMGQAELVPLRKGEVVFHQGDIADAMYVIESGSVAVYREQYGEEMLVRTLNQGDCFGEMSLLDLYPRSCSVIATDACVLIKITLQSLFGLYRDHLEQFVMIQMNIGREISRRLRLTDEKLFGERVTRND